MGKKSNCSIYSISLLQANVKCFETISAQKSSEHCVRHLRVAGEVRMLHAVREEGLLHRSDQLSFQEFIQFLIDTLRFAVTPIDQN